MAKIAVIYYSAYGHTYEMARSLEAGATSAGAETRLRKVRELAPDEVIATQKGWMDHRVATQHVAEATLDDLEWADGFAFGTPTRFGGPAAQLKQFIDTTGSIWQKGALADKAATSFTGAMNAHGGQESTILALNNIFYHWGAIIVPLGYTDPVVFAAGGNPYGASNTASGETVDEAVLNAAFHQGTRVARVAEALVRARAAG
ncbi:MAG TPA: NAD(P)H:quinone oxidoreductase [Candidatus Acidoferrales bacterium]|jgi:NAD(P)H dehydrogenase (quinone)|nr:NAD(P)H:quinone oxidoreductase [Candidatus Acidoferrales bacterium]